MDNPRKILFIELDGASWNVMEPLLLRGKLPNLVRLIDEGASGPLLSDPPLISPRLWVSIFSGKHSKKHGVEFFGNSSKMVKCKRIWDIFNERGLKVGVFGSFVTWPPYPVNGFMIPSLFALGPETWPAEYAFLQEFVLNERKSKQGISSNGKKKSPVYYAGKLKEHGVSLGTLIGAGIQLASDKLKKSPQDAQYWKKALAYLKISSEVFIHLYEKYRPDFATIHIHLCDALAHRYWKYYEPEKFGGIDPALLRSYGHVIPMGYLEADKVIGKIIDAAGDAVVMIMSDHGSEGMEGTRLSYKLNVDNFLDRYGLREKVVPAHVGLMTFCYFREPELMEKMEREFRSARLADTGQAVFDVLKEESLIGLRLSQGLWGKEMESKRELDLSSRGRCAFSELFIPERMEVSGTHAREGMFVIAGPGIKKGVRLQGAGIFDITPTALALSGFPVGRDMDGKPLLEALEESFLRENPPQYIDTYETEKTEKKGEASATYEQIKGRLQSLGYL